VKTRLPVHGAVPIAILLDEEITLADLKVYTVLASFQGSNDDAYPSREAIIARCGLVAETISRSVKHLMELGWIQRQQRGLGQTNVYRVMVESEDPVVTPRSLQEIASEVTPVVTPRSLPSSSKNSEKNTRKEQSGNLFEDEPKGITPEAVIALLNEIAGSRFREHKGTGLTKLIDQGYTLDDFRAVFTEKKRQWVGTDFEKYLRPATLLIPAKFEGYLAEAGKNRNRGTPGKFKASSFDASKDGFRVETL
jgi:uncharacterized phage protein (TIGR02220 family)